ncbi:hypothetical protein BDZ97DRAFT_1850733 [Flammula alnicola]|nr:hypothetical protein BDZ97DRAFT_1850733 [Flammula alnicola]
MHGFRCVYQRYDYYRHRQSLPKRPLRLSRLHKASTSRYHHFSIQDEENLEERDDDHSEYEQKPISNFGFTLGKCFADAEEEEIEDAGLDTPRKATTKMLTNGNGAFEYIASEAPLSHWRITGTLRSKRVRKVPAVHSLSSPNVLIFDHSRIPKASIPEKWATDRKS